MNPQGIDSGPPSYTQEEILAVIGDPAQWTAKRRRFEADSEFFFEAEDELLAKHPHRWVAFYGLKVVAVSESLEELLGILDDLRIPRAEALAEYLDPKPPRMILGACRGGGSARTLAPPRSVRRSPSHAFGSAGISG